MKIKVNDNVLILAGKDKGKQGKVIKTLKKESKVVVEGINISKRHTKPKSNNDKGGIFEIEMPIHVSNVKLITKDDKKAKATPKPKEKDITPADKKNITSEKKEKVTKKVDTKNKAVKSVSKDDKKANVKTVKKASK